MVCDRYYYSGMVYSAAKNNPNLPFPWARAPDVGLPRPDLAIFLDMKEDDAKKRGGWGDEIYEKAEIQRRVRNLFWGLSFGWIGRAGGRELYLREEEEDLYVIDAAPSIGEVADSIWEVANKRVKAVERGEVGKLVRRVS